MARETGYSIASVSKKLTAGKTPAQIRDDAKRAGIRPTVLVTSTGKLASKVEQLEHIQATAKVTATAPSASSHHSNGHSDSSNSSDVSNSARGRRSRDENFYEAQARKERVLADLRELEYQEKIGQLAPVEILNSWFSGCIVRARDILLNIGPELRDRVSQESNPVVCEELITFEIRRALGEMSIYGNGNAPSPTTPTTPTSASASTKET